MYIFDQYLYLLIKYMYYLYYFALYFNVLFCILCFTEVPPPPIEYKKIVDCRGFVLVCNQLNNVWQQFEDVSYIYWNRYFCWTSKKYSNVFKLWSSFRHVRTISRPLCSNKQGSYSATVFYPSTKSSYHIFYSSTKSSYHIFYSSTKSSYHIFHSFTKSSYHIFYSSTRFSYHKIGMFKLYIYCAL